MKDNDKDIKNSNIDVYGDDKMKKRDKLILSGFVAGCLLLTGLYSTIVFWLSETAEKIRSMGTLISICLIIIAVYIVWRMR